MYLFSEVCSKNLGLHKVYFVDPSKLEQSCVPLHKPIPVITVLFFFTNILLPVFCISFMTPQLTFFFFFFCTLFSQLFVANIYQPFVLSACEVHALVLQPPFYRDTCPLTLG